MKRITGLLLTALLLLTAGCQGSTLAPSQGNDAVAPSTSGTEAAPFGVDYEPQDNLDFFTQPESAELVASGGPYYISPQTLPMPAFEEFNKLKQAKVDEALEITDELISRAKNLEAKIRQYEVSLFTVLAAAVGADKTYGELTTENVSERAYYASKEQIIHAHLNSLPLENDEPYVSAGAGYNKSMLALELGGTILDDLTSVTLNAGWVYETLQSSENPEIKTALAAFDAEMEAISNAKADVEGIISKSAELDAALRQLATADYYMAQTGLEYMKTEIPKVREALEGLTPGEAFSQEDIVFAKQYLDLYEELAKDIESKLADLKDKDQLLTGKGTAFAIPVMPPKLTAAIPSAHADFWSAYESAKSGLSTAASAVGSGISATVDFGWQTTKTVVHGTQRVAGSVVEGAGTITKSTFDFYSGLYYGNSLADIKARQNQNYADWLDKTKNGTAGSETLKTAVQVLDKSEDIVSGIVTAPIKYTWGEGNVTWAVGGLTKIAAGAFTSLAKGSFTLANPESSGEDMFWGAFDVGTSLIGGSSSVLKASQETSGGASVGKNFLDRGVNYLTKLFTGGKAAKLADRMEEINKILKQGGLDDELKAALKKELKQAKYEINRLKNVANAADESTQALKQELKESAENFTKNTKELMKKNLQEQGENITKTFTEEIESSVSAYVKKFIDPIKSPADIFNGFVNGAVDKWLAGETKDFITKTLIPWLIGGYDGVYAGNWVTQAGSFPVALTVADNVITGSGVINMGYGGVSVSSTITIGGSVDSEGKISGTMSQSGKISGAVGGAGGGSGSFSGSIVDGVMTMNYSGSGSTTISAQGFSTTAGGSDAGTIVLKKQ